MVFYMHNIFTIACRAASGSHFAADAGNGFLRFVEFIGVEYRLLISLPIRLFLITGVTVDVCFFGFFAVELARTGAQAGFSSSELDEVRLGLGVQGLEKSPHCDSLELPIVCVRRFLLKAFLMLLMDGERRWKFPIGVAGVWRKHTTSKRIVKIGNTVTSYMYGSFFIKHVNKQFDRLSE